MGLGMSVAPRSSANRALSPGVFYPAIYAEDGEDGSPYPPGLPAHRGVSLAPGWRVLSVSFAHALPVRPSAQERTLSFRDPLRQHAFLSLGTGTGKCTGPGVRSVCRVLRTSRSRVSEKNTRKTLAFEHQCSSRPRGIHGALLRIAVRARWCARVECSECVCDRTSQEDAALPDVVGANTRTHGVLYCVRCEAAEEWNRERRARARACSTERGRERERASERVASSIDRFRLVAEGGKSQTVGVAAVSRRRVRRLRTLVAVVVRHSDICGAVLSMKQAWQRRTACLRTQTRAHTRT